MANKHAFASRVIILEPWHRVIVNNMLVVDHVIPYRINNLGLQLFETLQWPLLFEQTPKKKSLVASPIESFWCRVPIVFPNESFANRTNILIIFGLIKEKTLSKTILEPLQGIIEIDVLRITS